MNHDPVRVSRIDFRNAIPSLRLFESIPLAFSVQTLVPAFFAAVLGKWIISVFPLNRHWLFLHDWPLNESRPDVLIAIERTAREMAVHGFLAGFRALPRLLMLSAVLALCAVAVSRAAGHRFCCDRRTGAIRSLRHAVRSWASIGLGLALACAICGLPVAIFRASLLVTGVAPDNLNSAWEFVAPGWLAAVLLIVFLAVCGTGWLLSLAAIGIDSCDGPESLSRGICYVLSRFRMTVLQLSVVMMLTYLSAHLVSLIGFRAAAMVKEALGTQIKLNDRRVDFPFEVLTGLAAETIRLSVFFSGITVCYVLLRQAEDGVSLTETDGGKSNV